MQREDFCLVISSFPWQHICSKNLQCLNLYNPWCLFSVNTAIFLTSYRKKGKRCCIPAYLFWALCIFQGDYSRVVGIPLEAHQLHFRLLLCNCERRLLRQKIRHKKVYLCGKKIWKRLILRLGYKFFKAKTYSVWKIGNYDFYSWLY